MAFDQETRNLLQRTVTACRRVLDREFTAQLQELYGIQPDGSLTPLAALDHLGDEELDVARLLRERINHLEGGSATQALTRTAAKPEHIARVIREQAFTVLNRLAALRLCEERGLVLECVRQGVNSEGFQLFTSSAGNALGETHEAYRVYLHCLFDELALDLGVLFDRFSPLALLFPRHAALAEVLSELNGTGKAAEREEMPPEQFAQIWQADETIGWIYQYYNDETERKKMREESSAPRNSRELAVRNQFFTPRYVVEFLTDNTLGRIWYEMTQGQTRLKDQCRYLVRRPDEVFFGHLSCAGGENQEAGVIAMAQKLIEGVEQEFPAFSPADGQALIELAHTVNGYARHDMTEEGLAWFRSITRKVSDVDALAQVTTQDLVDALFLECRGMRHDGHRFDPRDWLRELWPMANEIRRRALQSRDPGLSQEQLLNQPVFIPYRLIKDPRTILMLDPACGSMHFGLYAFDLFEVIYAEAWDHHPELLQDLRSELSTINHQPSTPEEARRAFLRLVPRLIIEHNIHGIDIDPRCAQIAGLSLWLRAQRAWKDMGLAPAQRPAIKRSNIVCAEPMPGEKELLREFVEREFPATERGVVLRMLETIFDKMQLGGEAGSLLKIEEEIKSAIEEARDAWQKFATKPQELFTTAELNQISTAPELTGLEQAVSSLTSDLRPLTTDFWDRIEERIYAALRDYAESADSHGFQRRLFAEDAARGFAFIDVCRKRYDVALMNPPFGKPAAKSLARLKADYPDDWKDMYAAFFSRLRHMTTSQGFAGAITSLLYLYSKQLRVLRRDLIERKNLLFVVELGGGVLDGATVETALSVVNSQPNPTTLYLDLFQSADKGSALLEVCTNSGFQYRLLDDFMQLYGWPLCFHMPPEKLQLWKTPERLEPALAEIVAGNLTFDDFRFLRLRSEVPSCDVNIRWYAYEKGGEYQPFISPPALLFNWLNDGAEPRAYQVGEYGTDAQTIQSISKWFVSGLTYPRVNLAFSPKILPEGCIFSEKGMSVFLKDARDALPLLGLLASTWIDDLLAAFGRHRAYENSAVANLPFGRKLMAEIGEELGQLARKVVQAMLRRESHDETSPYFVRCPFDEADERQLSQRQSDILETCDSIDDVVGSALFGRTGRPRPASNETTGMLIARHVLGENDSQLLQPQRLSWALGCAFGRWDILYATGEKATPELPDPFAPLPVCAPGHLQSAQGLPARPEDVLAAYPVCIPWDGILVDDPNHPLDIERRVREVIEIIWSSTATSLRAGSPTAEAIEHEACEILGVESLRDYFRKPAGFFADHLKRYSKSRRQAPIYWPLSTASGSYTLWIYYHRLTPDTLYKCVQQFVTPKLADVEKELTHLRTILAANEGGAKERKRLEELEDLRRELIELRTELELWAPKWKPDLNDGVLITAAPLWKLFRLPKWQKDLKACWQELDKGDYDWSHLAHTLWPDRVREKCKTDRSLAIAHGLEDLCAVKAPEKKAKKAKKAKAVSNQETIDYE